MAILTLTTDLGTQDHYVGVLKGSLLSLAPTATMVDISHAITSFDIYQAAYFVKKSFSYFPEKTVHLIGVCPYSLDKYRYIAVSYRNHYFIGLDCGMFSAIFEEAPQLIVNLDTMPNKNLATFSILDLPVNAAAKLLNGAKLSDLGTKAERIVERKVLEPFSNTNSIDGYVAQVDKFKNVITDIPKELFYNVGKNRAFTLAFKSYTIQAISSHYEDVIQGEAVAFFNFQGFLEIAINFGDAATLLNFSRGEKIKIIFNDN